jgi:hypothetical protein
MLNRDDRVVYVGQKYSKELRGMVGYIVGRIEKEKNGFVVEFGSEAYVMPAGVLDKYRPSGKEDDAPEVHQRRRRKRDEETEE